MEKNGQRIANVLAGTVISLFLKSLYFEVRGWALVAVLPVLRGVGSLLMHIPQVSLFVKLNNCPFISMSEIV